MKRRSGCLYVLLNRIEARCECIDLSSQAVSHVYISDYPA